MTYHFDNDAAQLAVDFIQCLKHSKGPLGGQYFVLQPWQEDIIRNLFGWKREDGTRRYTKLFLEIARGAGKSFLSACISLVLLYLSEDAKPEIYIAATSIEQAGYSYQYAADCVYSSPSLNRVSKTTPNKRIIRNLINGGMMRVVSSDGSTSFGGSPSVVLIDEAHVWTKPRALELLSALRTGLVKRPNGLEIIISTAGHNKHTIFGREYMYAKAVKDGKVKDDTCLVRIFEADPKDPWDQPETWKKANPNLGVSVRFEEIEKEVERARSDPFYLNDFKRQYCNIWTSTEAVWISLETWDATAGTVNLDDLVGRECFAGLDLSTTTDLSAFVLLFPFPDGYKVVAHFFMPGETMHEKIKNDGVEYDAWSRNPLNNLHVTQGDSVDYEHIKKVIVEAHQKYQIKELAYDRAFAHKIAEELRDQHGLTVVPITQTPLALTAATLELSRLVRTKQLHHGGNQVLRWNVECGVLREFSTDLVKIVKPKRQETKNRIDGLYALTNALARAMLYNTTAPDILDNLIEAYSRY